MSGQTRRPKRENVAADDDEVMSMTRSNVAS